MIIYKHVAISSKHNDPLLSNKKNRADYLFNHSHIYVPDFIYKRCKYWIETGNRANHVHIVYNANSIQKKLESFIRHSIARNCIYPDETVETSIQKTLQQLKSNLSNIPTISTLADRLSKYLSSDLGELDLNYVQFRFRHLAKSFQNNESQRQIITASSTLQTNITNFLFITKKEASHLIDQININTDFNITINPQKKEKVINYIQKRIHYKVTHGNNRLSFHTSKYSQSKSDTNTLFPNKLMQKYIFQKLNRYLLTEKGAQLTRTILSKKERILQRVVDLFSPNYLIHPFPNEIPTTTQELANLIKTKKEYAKALTQYGLTIDSPEFLIFFNPYKSSISSLLTKAIKNNAVQCTYMLLAMNIKPKLNDYMNAARLLDLTLLATLFEKAPLNFDIKNKKQQTTIDYFLTSIMKIGNKSITELALNQCKNITDIKKAVYLTITDLIYNGTIPKKIKKNMLDYLDITIEDKLTSQRSELSYSSPPSLQESFLINNKKEVFKNIMIWIYQHSKSKLGFNDFNYQSDNDILEIINNRPYLKSKKASEQFLNELITFKDLHVTELALTKCTLLSPLDKATYICLTKLFKDNIINTKITKSNQRKVIKDIQTILDSQYNDLLKKLEPLNNFETVLLNQKEDLLIRITQWVYS
ncbi:hypothetical protein DID75_03030 [Candidatus Marinamargulisbacteria bacterium SCGC AG-410-N11]|nr:hypothetical protein DID75_03030 [Candidatus Marinamargulisbacteria bacterium SCGC AG-410-N11]